MKTIFNNTERAELIERIELLTPNNTAQWGKMNVYQMIKHCTIWNDWVLGRDKHHYKQEFLGKIFGKMALKGMIKDDKPLKKNVPAGIFAVKDNMGQIDTAQKKTWMEQIESYGHYSNPDFVHDFFGKMETEQIGIFVYKHMDHHLRQFGV
ncbi:DUF1569 domain-containing protein [Sphingobacterium sp. ML3W]|uniref:DUF1569 domain-containing protein n=1 Tax=Sphingobacterium sp. ML3W TaxID=1538644 RepID=UPI00249CC383|nr:DUF1569 domain-containing protein [Sphingobacterium sp. ML3W]WFA81603.1 DUF1569 domain-containing protein [Sphingobacterium sp. ML3W]